MEFRRNIDHLIYAVPDLAVAVADVEERFGVRAQSGGKHTGAGTHNALLALGSRTYLEILAPDPEQLTRPYQGLPHGRLAGWAIACDDIDGAVAAARGHGCDPGEVIDGHRTAPSGVVLRWRATSFKLADGLVPFLICWGNTEHPASTAPSGLTLERLAIEHPDPPSLRPALTALGADVEVSQATAPALVAHLDGPHGRAVLR